MQWHSISLSLSSRCPLPSSRVEVRVPPLPLELISWAGTWRNLRPSLSLSCRLVSKSNAVPGCVSYILRKNVYDLPSMMLANKLVGLKMTKNMFLFHTTSVFCRGVRLMSDDKGDSGCCFVFPPDGLLPSAVLLAAPEAVWLRGSLVQYWAGACQKATDLTTNTPAAGPIGKEWRMKGYTISSAENCTPWSRSYFSRVFADYFCSYFAKYATNFTQWDKR